MRHEGVGDGVAVAEAVGLRVPHRLGRAQADGDVVEVVAARERCQPQSLCAARVSPRAQPPDLVPKLDVQVDGEVVGQRGRELLCCSESLDFSLELALELAGHLGPGQGPQHFQTPVVRQQEDSVSGPEEGLDDLVEVVPLEAADRFGPVRHAQVHQQDIVVRTGDQQDFPPEPLWLEHAGVSESGLASGH